jgi:excisionase family DNA binding protein
MPTPVLLTPTEVAELLRTSRKAMYTMIERAQLPGIVRIGRRVLVRAHSTHRDQSVHAIVITRTMAS